MSGYDMDQESQDEVMDPLSNAEQEKQNKQIREMKLKQEPNTKKLFSHITPIVQKKNRQYYTNGIWRF